MLTAALDAWPSCCLGPADRPNRWLVTCRMRAWERSAELRHFDAAYLQPLSPDDVARFATCWLGAAHAVAPGELLPPDSPLVQGSLRALGATRRRSRDVRNPQTLTMLLELLFSEATLPEERARLYQRCVDRALDKCARHHQLDTWGGRSVGERALRALAVALHEARTPDGHPVRELGYREAAKLLATQFEGIDLAAAQDLLHALELHARLLQRRGPHVRFAHRTLQEYLVARSLIDGEPAASLCARLRDATWVEVIALVAGVLMAEGSQQRTRDYLVGLLAEAAGEPPAARAPVVGAVARCLADLEACKADRWG